MKLEFWESEYGSEITLKPETTKEMSELLRMANNSKREPAQIVVCFADEPTCRIWFKKVKKSSQSNSLSAENNTRK